MNFNRMYGLFLRHFFLIKSSFPRILDLIYWPSIQIILWGFISKFFTTYSDYYNNTVGIILTCAILYDFLFRSSISFNMLFLEEIWSRNFTNLFIAPMKISEIIISLVFTALIRTLIGIVPAILLASPFFGVSLFDLGPSLMLLLISLYIFGITLGLFVVSGLLRYGPSFENVAWSSLFLLAPLGCIYYPLSILPEWLQVLAKALPSLKIVHDHFGGPLGIGPYKGKREEIFDQWKEDIKELSQCKNVFSKLGGLAMPVNGWDWHKREIPASSDEIVSEQSRYYLHTLECFGPERCMFESNFPVDKQSVSYHVIWNAYKKLTHEFSEQDKESLFYGTAEKVYKL